MIDEWNVAEALFELRQRYVERFGPVHPIVADLDPELLYVVLEMIKIGQAWLIGKDMDIYDPETGYSLCRNSDLIEEMGQVEFIFSDKTGTLTCNVMEFK
jgi:phospholipid-transporting ATPase